MDLFQRTNLKKKIKKKLLANLTTMCLYVLFVASLFCYNFYGKTVIPEKNKLRKQLIKKMHGIFQWTYFWKKHPRLYFRCFILMRNILHCFHPPTPTRSGHSKNYCSTKMLTIKPTISSKGIRFQREGFKGSGHYW